MTQENKEKLREEWEKEFDEHVNIVRRETHWGTSQDSPTHFFGHKTWREIEGVTELFTVVDWANVKKFISSLLQSKQKELIEAGERMRKEYESDDFEDGGDEEYRNRRIAVQDRAVNSFNSALTDYQKIIKEIMR